MSDIDQFGYPDFEAPYDGRIGYLAGQQSGKIVLLNGQKQTLPWKSQQEIPDSDPAQIYCQELNAGGLHVQLLTLQAARLYADSIGATIRLSSSYADSSSDYSYIEFNSGRQAAADTTAVMTLRSSVGADGTEGLYVATPVHFSDDVTVPTGVTVEIAHLHVTGEGGHHTSIRSGSGQNIEIITGSVSGDLVLTSTGGAVNVTSGGTMTLDSVGAVVVESDGLMTLRTTGSGDNILLSAPSANITLTSSVGSIDLSLCAGAATSYTPTITQGVAVSKTVTSSYYTKVGRWVTWHFNLAITSSGTAANTVTLSLPFTAASSGNGCVGMAVILNGGTNNFAPPALNSTTTIAFYVAGGFWTTQLVNTNNITGFITYQATS